MGGPKSETAGRALPSHCRVSATQDVHCFFSHKSCPQDGRVFSPVTSFRQSHYHPYLGCAQLVEIAIGWLEGCVVRHAADSPCFCRMQRWNDPGGSWAFLSSRAVPALGHGWHSHIIVMPVAKAGNRS